MPDTPTHRITIRPDVSLGRISPKIYGQFIEHLGRCVTEGIWVGEDSKIPNTRGIRNDTVEALKAIHTPVVRWPGGCFADDYHWTDGIGPRGKRPVQFNRWGPSEENNHFGTHEFIDFCGQVGTQPYICANVGSGSPTEAAHWVEYCNYAGRTAMASLRRKNGAKEPFNVRYWGVGNENWGCGGHMEPEEYASLYRRFAGFMRSRDPSIELVACGHTTADWNWRFLKQLRHKGLMDHLSIHVYYVGGGNDADFTPTEYYNMVLRSLVMEREIALTREAIEVFVRGEKPIGIIIDEWGTWHPQARGETGLEQHDTMRDAVIAAGTFDIFNKYASCVAMANIAQTMNVLQCMAHTEGDTLWLTPTYHVFDLYKDHMGAESVHLDIDTVMVEARDADGGKKGLPVLSASASLNAEEKTLLLTVTNRHIEEQADVDIRIAGDYEVKGATMHTLAARDIHDYNDAAAPDRVRPAPARKLTTDELPHLLAAKSVTAIEYRLA